MSHAYHPRTDLLLEPILEARRVRRVKRARQLVSIATASGYEHARAARAGLALTSATGACAELIQSTGMWANEADAIRLAYAFFQGVYSNG